MRCKNCGWPNKPGESACVKCHTPLMPSYDQLDPSNGAEMSQSSRPLSKTVLEGAVFDEKRQNDNPQGNSERANSGNSVNSDTLTNCPKCGYPLRAGVEKCPNCRFLLVPNQQPQDQECPRSHNGMEDAPMRRQTRVASANETKGNYKGTVNPYMMSLEADPTFTLKPIRRMDERHDFAEQEYEGDEVVLNRDNTERNNLSITSKQQAVVTNIDGRWFIEDKSEQKTTFVQASCKTELHDGDIILLGNRMFQFHE